MRVALKAIVMVAITPTGVFVILQKAVTHKSNKYRSAPMPFLQRLTWDGIAMHAGRLPGYPASHGCIRLPAAFAKLLSVLPNSA
jgi:lipoprotein-anchoring transpeptidase ErfK/SrfK